MERGKRKRRKGEIHVEGKSWEKEEKGGHGRKRSEKRSGLAGRWCRVLVLVIGMVMAM